ncbi:TPA: aconitate hydratase AcnA [Legionella pneumophila]|uniref:Aconitate hydratase A n=6 Tax=Legionella pneumophila TaxID=446 RepID=ACON_LEGPH|nr:aconitate hydratase AcnA [Legionella pneumophila]P37032.1 RecName: Full=Aconitate hydratase A; Short=ACN; Short=Aconitase; AltName: Full=(2R,3S)-2-methylisocitrate dehydratase; AltName: Full=(2S,3R)-3-hydroxybutane-1,2,3-tricarboxylate dehydratase; AltName: Full=IP210; AltName: Full=Iron-responsive protein-like; Short=IRP-like; AltName: Full=Major iron-containing protein; Short=MICP; AltName: Full=Probable 2-methyl-cis-aconitate hydratase; AltName: Full=RNA-binding protein [Legionella pneumophi
MKVGQDSLSTKSQLTVDGKTYNYYSLKEAENKHFKGINRLPYSLKVLLENLLRFEDGNTVTTKDIKAIADWLHNKTSQHEIAFRPTRVLMQDFTGVPAVVDLAAMRTAIVKMGGNADKISPLSPVDLVIDHSVMVDKFASADALEVNTKIEIERNKERYEFLRWGQKAFSNFQVVPPGTGICHQVNLEYLGKTVWNSENDGQLYAYPDTLVGTDSHTTMINGLGVLGWGVGGIEAEAAMLGQPVSMLIPEVIGFKLSGKLKEGITATDLVLTVTQMLRKKGVVGKFVEFYGPGLNDLPLADRATISNMAPEYGATCGFFPVDKETIKYLELTGRDKHTIALVEAYAKAQGMWYDKDNEEPVFTDSLHLDLGSVEPSLAGPKRPQDKVNLSSLPVEFNNFLIEVGKEKEKEKTFAVKNKDFQMKHGHVVIAAITSCTNTSNPSVLMAAGLVAKKAIEKGLQRKPWVKSSLAPGSKVVTDYLRHAGLQTYLDQLGFNLVGYGCTTCIGNSGPLPDDISHCVAEHDLVVSSVLSGNRNFEGRVHPQVRANWLASPPLVVAYALCGTTCSDLSREPIGQDKEGNDVYLKDIWPSNEEIAAEVAKVSGTMFRKEYAEVFKGDAHWQAIQTSSGQTYEWNPDSTYIQHPPFFENLSLKPEPLKPIKQAYVLALFGDSITTDHISPAGSIKASSPAGLYLKSKGVDEKDFNSYGSRRGNHEVMMRGTFANIRIRNEMTPGQEGGVTRYVPTGETMSIYDAAMRYQENQQDLVIIAGKEYGTGSSRDWAAKGTNLLGVKAVITESFERIHRSNLIGMGILPLQFKEGTTRKTLKLDGSERISIEISDKLTPGAMVPVTIERQDGDIEKIETLCRIDTADELEYYKNGGILQYVLRKISS